MHTAKENLVRNTFEHYDERRSIKILKNDNSLDLMQNTILTGEDRKEEGETPSSIFNYHCVSLIRTDGTSLDLIVKDQSDIMVLINIVQATIGLRSSRSQVVPPFYRLQRIKMKLGYSS